jgi:hypothetical protein
MTRAAVRAIVGFCGINPPANEIDLNVDQPVVQVGSAVTGIVQIIGDYAHEVSVTIALEGVESTVVALSQKQLQEHGNVGIEYLRKHTTEQHVIFNDEITLHNAEHPVGFRFALPEDSPATLRCVLDGTNPLLPSQCQIKYTVTASIANHTMSAKRQVSYPIVVLSKRESDILLDPSIQVSVGSAMDVFYRNMFSCGGNEMMLWPSCSMGSKSMIQQDIEESTTVLEEILDSADSLEDDEEDDDDENDENREPNIMMKTFTSKPHFILEASRAKLNLSPGQTLEVSVKDWFRQLKSGVWMIRFVEDLSWVSQGRTARSQQSWDLYANHHEFPTGLRQSFKSSLISVRHELIVYLATKDTSKDIMAMTEPIPVSIVSNQRGWDA